MEAIQEDIDALVSLEQRITEAVRLLADLRGENNRLQGRLKTVEEEVRFIGAERDELRALSAEMEKENAGLGQEVRRLSAELDELRGERKQVKARIEKLLSQCRTITDDLAQNVRMGPARRRKDSSAAPARADMCHVGKRAVDPPGDVAEHALRERLCQIQEEGKVPLLSADMDDTFLPFGALLTETEIGLLVAYLESGGQIAINTLAPKEWFLLRVVEPMARAFHQRRRVHLLSRVHWIVSGGREIFVFDATQQSYRRIYAAAHGNKAEGLLRLARELGDAIAILALYGDCFGDPGNDGNAIGREGIPLVINVGADHSVVRSEVEQLFINTIEKGPRVILRHLAFVADRLRNPVAEAIPAVESTFAGAALEDRNGWHFGWTDFPDCPEEEPLEVQGHGSGFVWSWNREGICYVTPLLRRVDPQASGPTAYGARLPKGTTGFTFFWTGGDDARGGQLPGHWEGRDFLRS